MMRKIIIGYDPDSQGDDALSLGSVMSGLLGAKPTVAVVTHWHEHLLDREPLEHAIEAEIAQPRARASELLAGLDPDVLGLPWRSPAAVLHDLAVAEQAGLIVIGSARRGPVGQLTLGSVGESLLHGAPCAVAVAPRGFAEREETHVLRIGVAFDGSAEAWSALETAIGLAERVHGELTVMTVAEFPTHGSATSWSILTAGEFRDFERDEKQRVLDLALARIPSALAGEGRLMTGEVGELLAQTSGEFDLVVTGSRGYGPLRRTLLGNATRKLMRTASCPVIVLPRASGTDPLGVRDPRTHAARTSSDAGAGNG